MGDMPLAEAMIKEASRAGADYAKFQTWRVDRLKPGSWDTDGRRQIYEKAQLSHDKHLYLIDACARHQIRFLSSVFSVPDAEYLHSLGQKAIKIPSFEVANIPLLEYVSTHFDKIFLSLGTASVEDIQVAVKILPKSTTYMHCVSAYPCKLSTINLPRLRHLQNMGLTVGFSDHTQGIEASVLSLSYNPVCIEKHFTTDHDLPGRDNKFAILPEELESLRKFINAYKDVSIDHGLDFQDIEADSRNNYRGRFNG